MACDSCNLDFFQNKYYTDILYLICNLCKNLISLFSYDAIQTQIIDEWTWYSDIFWPFCKYVIAISRNSAMTRYVSSIKNESLVFLISVCKKLKIGIKSLRVDTIEECHQIFRRIMQFYVIFLFFFVFYFNIQTVI